LLAYGADSLLRNKFGEYAVHAAARNGQIASIRAFAEYDCDLNVKNYSGKTPLGEARMNGHADIVEFIRVTFKEEERSGLEDLPEEPLVMKQDHNWVKVLLKTFHSLTFTSHAYSLYLSQIS
jgi:ankyrin repeat protein